MKTILLVAAMSAGPLVASAQTETLDYQGYVMGGTSTFIASDPENHGFYDYECGCQSYSTVSTTATFNAQVTFTGSVAQNNLEIVSAEVDLSGNNGASFQYNNLTNGNGPGSIGNPVPFDNGFGTNPYPVSGGGWCFSSSASIEGCVKLTTASQAVTGATFDIYTTYVTGGTSPPNYGFVIGPNGDSFDYGVSEFDICGSTAYGDVTYIGPRGGGVSKAPCLVNVSNPTAGVWTQAPEIDGSFALSGIMLLAGGLAVLLGKIQLAR